MVCWGIFSPLSHLGSYRLMLCNPTLYRWRLEMKSATVEDSGMYKLVVKNATGDAWCEASVLVKGKAPASSMPVSSCLPFVIKLHVMTLFKSHWQYDTRMHMYLMLYKATVYVLTNSMINIWYELSQVLHVIRCTIVYYYLA